MNVLVTAIGSMSADCVISSLRSMGVSHVSGSNSLPRDFTPAASLVDSFHLVPAASETNAYRTRLLDICLDEGISHLIVLTDVEIDALLEVREDLLAGGTTLCIPSSEAIKVCRDKMLLHDTFREDTRINVIPTVKASSITRPEDVRFPLLAKPRAGRSSEGLLRFDTRSDLEANQQRLDDDYILQPALAGSIFVVDIVRHGATGRMATMAREELLRTANGAGLTVRMHPRGEINEMAMHFAEELSLNGCINIEFIVSDSHIWLMDANPRFSAGVAFSRMAGYDMVKNHLRCFSGAGIEVAVSPSACVYGKHYVEMAMV